MRIPGRAQKVPIAVAVAVLLLLALQGCRYRGEGPMEKTGRAVDRSGEKVGNVFRR